MTRQLFRTADRVRLEVQADNVATTNLIRNGVPELGTYTWRSLASTTRFEARGTDTTAPYFRLLATGGTSATNIAQVFGETFTVTPGQYLGVGLDWSARSAATVRLTLAVYFYDAAGAQRPGPPTSQQFTAVGERINLTPLIVPAGYVKARLQITVFNTAGRTEGDFIEFTRVAARCAGAAASVTAVPYTEPYEWLNVLGKSHEIRAEDAGLDVGYLTATIYDATLDPAVSPALQPGRLVRLTAQNPDAGMSARWESLFRGVLLKGLAEYDYRQTVVDRRAKIQISAANGVAQASNVTRPQGVATIEDMAFLFEAASVPWAVNGSGTQPAGTPTYVTSDPSKSLLDQVAIARDSQRGYAWVDRRGVLNISTAAARPTAVSATLAEDAYSDLSVDYDTDRCINEVTVRLLRNNLATGQTVEVVYGPYRDQASVDKWGAHSQDFTVQGIADTEAAAQAYATAVLSANATPVRKVNSLRIPVRTWADLTPSVGSKRAMLDTYDLVRVTNTTGGLDQQLRPTKITHTLTAGNRTDKWLADVEFGTDSGAATPIDVPSPPGGTVAAGSTAATDPGAQAGSNVVIMNQFGRVTFPIPFASGVVPVVTLTGGNGESLSFVYGGAVQPDNTGFGFYANQQNGTAITTGSVRVCWIAMRPT